MKKRVRPSLTAVPAIYLLRFLRFCLYIVLDAMSIDIDDCWGRDQRRGSYNLTRRLNIFKISLDMLASHTPAHHHFTHHEFTTLLDPPIRIYKHHRRRRHSRASPRFHEKMGTTTNSSCLLLALVLLSSFFHCYYAANHGRRHARPPRIAAVVVGSVVHSGSEATNAIPAGGQTRLHISCSE